MVSKVSWVVARELLCSCKNVLSGFSMLQQCSRWLPRCCYAVVGHCRGFYVVVIMF